MHVLLFALACASHGDESGATETRRDDSGGDSGHDDCDGKGDGASLWYGDVDDAMPGDWVDGDAAARFVGETADDQPGSALAIADLDANGRGDLLFGSPGEASGANNAGALYVWMSD